MALQVVQTTDPGMQAAANEFAAKTEEFTGHLRSVNTEMAALQTSWRGDASDVFNQAMDNWEMSFQRVINQLMHMMDVMGVTTKGYRDAEDQASEVAKSFGAMLPPGSPLPGV